MRFEVFRPLLAALVVAGAFGMNHRAIASPVAPSEAETQPALDAPVTDASVDSSLPMPDLGRVRLADATLDATLDETLSEPSPVADLESAPATTDLLEVSPELSPEVEPLEVPSTLPPEMEGASSAADLSASEITSEAIAIPVDMLLSGTLPVDVNPAMAQVTSVQQFSDVQPSDWAYEALAYLANSEAEGGLDCLEGYPDGTFRGGRAMTRYEFAAGLASCLDAVVGRLDSLDPEALARIEALQREFAAELAVLRGRVDALEAAVAELEANQFSTTTVLRGNAWMNLTQAFPDGRILTERNPFAPNAFAPPIRDANGRPSRVFRDQPQLTFSYYVNLNLNTSFTGRDSLVTQLAVGNGNSPANELVSSGFFNSWGVPFTDQGAGTPNNVVVRELFYSFPIGDAVQVDIGPRLNYYRYFDGNRFTFFQTGASSFNSSGSTLLSAIDRGSGIVIRWKIIDPLQLTVGYLAENAEFLNPAFGFNTSSNPGDGLFNSSNIITAQLAFSPSRNFNLRLLYARSSLKPYNGFIGGAVGEPVPYGYIDDGFGGFLNDSGADTLMANFDWQIADWIGLFARYSWGRVDVNPVAREEGRQVRVQSFQVGLGFPDLFKRGALGVISFLIPHDYLAGEQFLLSGGGDGGTQAELEVSYRYPVSDNISLVPAFYAIWNANNFDSNPTVYVGNLRFQFSF